MKQLIIKVDWDSKKLKPLKSRLKTVLNKLGTIVKFEQLKLKRTANGYHLYLGIFVPDEYPDNLTTLIFQLLLGSDYKRELYNYKRICKHIQDWNVLFTAKYNGELKKISQEEPTRQEKSFKKILKDFKPEADNG